MIPDITELNFPKGKDGLQYATLSKATVTLADMDEKTITSDLRIDGGITPDFSYDWAVEFRGEKYIMPLRIPQGSKGNDSLSSALSLTFQHWAVYQLKRWPFTTIQQIEAGTYLPDEEVATLFLNLPDFCDLLSQVLEYYYGGRITVDLNLSWIAKRTSVKVEINHSKIWDVLVNTLYPIYGVRWEIKPTNDNDNKEEGGERYVIRIGYGSNEVTHIFEYGFEGGLMKLERQVQSEEIRNMLKGRGGTTNIPFRYFKDTDPGNKQFRPDPDWVKELENIYFPNLMPATFRSYIQGWKAAHISQYPGYTAVGESNAYAPWAYRKGYTDTKFAPVEFVADEITINPASGDKQMEILPGYSPYVKKGSSLDKYGPLPDTLDNNEDIYPTIQGTGMDIAVAIEHINADKAPAGGADADKLVLGLIRGTAMNVPAGARQTALLVGQDIFGVDTDMSADLNVSPYIAKVTAVSDNSDIQASVAALMVSYTINVYNAVTGEKRSASGIPPGRWRYEVEATVENLTGQPVNITAEDAVPCLISADINSDAWKDTFDIWVKNIWDSVKLDSETDGEYAERVWRPVLGDREGNPGKVMFTSGDLAHEDYEFTITGIPVPDNTQSYTDDDGTVHTSHWRITLAKSDAEFEATGFYIPSVRKQAKAGDTFAFIGTEMTHHYIVWNEKALDDWKKDQLGQKKEIRPTLVVGTDRVRLGGEGKKDALINQLSPGDSVRVADKRFILAEGDKAYETLYLQSMTITYREPTKDDTALNPDVELTLGAEYETSANTVSLMQGEITALQRQVGSVSNIEQAVRSVGDRLYLRKDGIPDRSYSPTSFDSDVSSLDFRAGITGGRGWSIGRDANGNAVLEIDNISVRKEMQVNTLVTNNAEGRGGMIIDTAAVLTITNVVRTQTEYICYFDQKCGSVANLFHVGDVAFCMRWSAEYNTQKYYKRRVMAVTAESVSLTRGYTASGANGDKGVDGSGIPNAGDVIIHFGSYTDARRRSVRISDVVGGGYIRMLDGLDSVKSAGKEYFFAGKLDNQYGDKPRLFIGDESGQYIEYREDQLNIKANLNIQSTVGDKTLPQFISDNSTAVRGIDVSADYIMRGPDNKLSPATIHVSKYLIRGNAKNSTDEGFVFVTQTGTDVSGRLLMGDEKSEGELTVEQNAEAVVLELNTEDDGSGDSYTKTIPVISDLSELEIGTANLITNSKGPFVTKRVSEESTTYNTVLASSKIIRLVSGQYYTLRAKTNGVFVDNIDNAAVNGAVAIYAVSINGIYTQLSDSSTGGTQGTTFKWTGNSADYLYVAIRSIGEVRTFSELMLVKGNRITTDWSPSSEDFDYVTEALEQDSRFSGGLMLTSHIKTGYTDDTGERVTKAGMNGIYEDEETLALWAGGDALDAEDGAEDAATFAVRMNGTGYACGNTVKFLKEEMRVGQFDEVRLNKEGLFMYDKDGNIRMQVSDKDVALPYEAVYNPVKTLNETYSVQGKYSRTKPYVSFSIPGTEIGTFETGRQLELGVEFSFSLAPGQKLSASQKYTLHITVYGSGEGAVNGEYTVTGQGGVTDSIVEFVRKINLTLTPGTYSIGMQLKSNFSVGDPGTLYDTEADLSVTGTASVMFDDMTKMGKNGFISSWNNSVLAITPSAFLAKVGGTALKMTDSGGIEKWENNKWTKL